jgi:16S rRNA processing protein RimM
VSLLNAGRVGRPHGLDGSFHVTRPRGILLSLGGAVRIGGDVFEIVRRAGTEDRPILRLRGVDRAAIETLRGADLMIERADAPALPEGEYWAEDLEGCLVVTADDGRELGVVARLRPLPSCEALEVGDLLVPMVGDAVLDVDIAARRIVVDSGFLGIEASS